MECFVSFILLHGKSSTISPKPLYNMSKFILYLFQHSNICACHTSVPSAQRASHKAKGMTRRNRQAIPFYIKTDYK